MTEQPKNAFQGLPLVVVSVKEINQLPNQHPEQLNTEIVIIKTIQGLTTCISNELEKLSPSNLTTYTVEVGKKRLLIADALEVIASFEKNELYELQKAFE